MKNLLIYYIVAMLTFAALTTSTAQTAPAPLENLFRLEGSWQGNATLILDGNTFSFVYYMRFEKSPENSGLYMEEWFTHADLGSLKGYNLIGFNARDEKIHWFSVDNFGTTHDHIGYWKSPDHFYMETSEKNGGKKYEEFIDLIFQPNGQVSLRLVAKNGNDIYEDISGDFTKQP